MERDFINWKLENELRNILSSHVKHTWKGEGMPFKLAEMTISYQQFERLVTETELKVLSELPKNFGDLNPKTNVDARKVYMDATAKLEEQNREALELQKQELEFPLKFAFENFSGGFVISFDSDTCRELARNSGLTPNEVFAVFRDMCSKRLVEKIHTGHILFLHGSKFMIAWHRNTTGLVILLCLIIAVMSLFIH